MERGDNTKKVFIFIICFFFFLISSIIPINYSYFNSLKLPFFMLPINVIKIIYLIIYIISTYGIVDIIKYKYYNKFYLWYLVIMYIGNIGISLSFYFGNLLLAFISSLMLFITLLLLYKETFLLNEKSTKYLEIYILFSLYITILNLTIYVLNTL